jgi:hypothetical protein
MDPKEKKRTLPLSQVDLSYSAPFVVRMTENKYYARSYDDVPPPVMSMFAEHEPSLRANQARSVDRGRQYMPPLSSYLNPQIEETVKENPLTSTQQLDRRRRHDTVSARVQKGSMCTSTGLCVYLLYALWPVNVYSVLVLLLKLIGIL